MKTQFDLTLKEAQVLMRKGVRVSHPNLVKNTWITYSKLNSMVVEQDETSHNPEKYFENKKHWEKPWGLFEQIENRDILLARKQCLASVENWGDEHPATLIKGVFDDDIEKLRPDEFRSQALEGG
jgi:hypothetical protein